MRTITLEEHYASPGFFKGSGLAMKEQAGGYMAKIMEQLCDVGEKRIAAMDAAGIDVQVLSLNAPGTEQLGVAEAKKLAKEANDFVADAIRRNPTRFAGFAALATADPNAAVSELERTVHEYGFKGAMICGHIGGRYLDNKFFWPVLERAEALHVPIYLHPTQAPQAVLDVSYKGFSQEVSFMLAGAGWGWHIETATHILRMILGRVFDRYPELQLVIGHMGETLPFMIQRLDDTMPTHITKLKHPLGFYLRNNIHYTFSGFNYTATFLNLLLEVGIDRIMFSADHPYSSMSKARFFLDQLPISDSDREKIAHGNAERLLKI
jgi:predicted TIM-barrel fold metal-dependent hydrolase